MALLDGWTLTTTSPSALLSPSDDPLKLGIPFHSHAMDCAPSAKDFEYMPSIRNGRRYSFSILSSSQTQPSGFPIRPSASIEPYISMSAKRNFNFSGKATRSQNPLGSGRFLHPAPAPVATVSLSPIPPGPSTRAQSPPVSDRFRRPRPLAKSPPPLASPGPSHPSPAHLPTSPVLAPAASTSYPSAPAPAAVSSLPLPLPLSSPPLSSPPPLSPTHLSASASVQPIEDETFAYRCLQAVKLAAAAQAVVAIEESHAWARIREERLILNILEDEAEYTSSRNHTAMHQLRTIYEEVKSHGVELPDLEEIQHEASQLGPEAPQSPYMSPKTPPDRFHELVRDVMNPSPGSHEPSQLLSMSLSTSAQSSLPEHGPLSPVPNVLHALPRLSPTGQAPSDTSPSDSSPTTPPLTDNLIPIGAADGENRKGEHSGL